MKKDYWLGSVFVSYLFTSLSVFVTPGYQFGTQYAYGFPFSWLLVDKEITMASRDLLFDHSGLGLFDFILDIGIYLLIIRMLTLLYKVIFKKNKVTSNQQSCIK